MDDSERYPLIRGVPQWYDGPVPVNNVAADTPDKTTSKSKVFNVDFGKTFYRVTFEFLQHT